MRKLSLLLLSIAFCCILFAQDSATVKGVVVDAKTGEKLLGVNVFIESIAIGTSTDTEGRFSLTGIKKGTYMLTASFLGYKQSSKKVHLENKSLKTISFFLEESAQSLEEVTITAKSEARKLREQAMPISVISMNQLSGTVNSIADVLNKTLGVTIRNSGGVGGTSRISVRGLEGKRIGFFIDEAPMNDNTDFLDINDIPVDMIDRIEVYKGVVPAKFGGSAIGGAVNIVLKEYPPKYFDFSYAIESFNTHKISTVAKRNLQEKGLEVGIGGYYTYSDNDYEMELPFDPKKRKVRRSNDQFKKITIGASLRAKKWWFDEVSFEPVFVKTKKQIQGVYQKISEAKYESQAYFLATKMVKTDFLTPGLDMDFSNAFAYTIYELDDYAKKAFHWDGTPRSTAGKYGGEITRYPSDSYNQQYLFQNKTNLNYIINNNNSINFNSLYKFVKGIPKDDLKDLAEKYKSNFDSNMNSWVVGITHEFRNKRERWLNSFTGKFYYYSIKTKNAVPYIKKVTDINMHKSNFGLSNASRYKITPSFMIKGSIAYDIRLPSENELLGDGKFIKPSGDLSPERSTSGNLGILLDQNGNTKHNLQVELNLFYMHLKDMIGPNGGSLDMNYKNYLKIENKGIEFEIKADILPWLYAYANTTYQDMRNIANFERDSQVVNPNKDKRQPNIPYFVINSGVELHKENFFGGTSQNSRFLVDGTFIDEYSYDYEHSTEYKERAIPKSFVIDLGFEHSFNDGSIILSLKAKNITNQIYFTEFKRPQPQRNFGLKLRYILK